MFEASKLLACFGCFISGMLFMLVFLASWPGFTIGRFSMFFLSIFAPMIALHQLKDYSRKVEVEVKEK